MRGHQYKSKLDAKSAAEGIRLANENARALFDDAQLLLLIYLFSLVRSNVW
jgi:hypothetical protein